MVAKKLSKKLFLEELLSGKGVAEICRDYGYKTTGTVYSWKKRDEKFAAEWDKIMESPFHKTRVAASQSPIAGEEGWRERFISKFRETKDRVLAADFAGKSVSEIMERADPSHDNHDQQFHDMLYEEELRDAVRIEDEVMRRATVGNSAQTQKFLLPYLPVVGDKYSKGVKKEDKGGETNIFVFNPQSMEGAQRQIIDVFGAKSLPATNES